MSSAFVAFVIALHAPVQGQDVDECIGISCGGASACINGLNKFTCECAAGWEGGGDDALCSDINECNGISCGGASVCINGLNKFTCECDAGWSGGGDNAVCQALSPGLVVETLAKDPCESNYCNYRGMVSGNQLDGCTCSNCQGGYAGATCNDKKACDSNYCNNRGTIGGNQVNGCTCSACTDGYEGATCGVPTATSMMIAVGKDSKMSRASTFITVPYIGVGSGALLLFVSLAFRQKRVRIPEQPLLG